MRKKNIPGLQRLREESERKRRETDTHGRGFLAWCKRRWVYITSVLAGLGGVIAFVLTQGPTALTNAQMLPGKIKETVSMARSWYYDDAKWTGAWSDMVEGVIGGPELSRNEVYLTLDVQQGIASGTISTKEICRVLPFMFVQFKGEIISGQLYAKAYDWIDGKEESMFSFRMHNGVITALVDPLRFLPDKAVLDKEMGKVGNGEYAEAKMSGLECKYQSELKLQRFLEHLDSKKIDKVTP
ncbi:hypothetical protein HBDW_45750 [Herbaspirillum sp. DW155]|uniref:hypothetical protein n=1 Tax=Herbaspirillum sp. DW155 TaxID=3095609 RepID=UPI003089D8A6|nr:hypothetical protein HBDW_45750 [Herbaspirillum sp. DW155]